VIFVDREYVRELAGDETAAQITIVKSRDGRVGQFPAKFNVRTLRFEEAPEPSQAQPWRDYTQPSRGR